MKIAEFLSPEAIIADLSSRSKSGVIQELSEPLSRLSPGVKPQRVAEVLEAREKLGSTGIGDGVAIPHGKMSELPRLVASFGISREGVNFDAIDGKPTHLFFALVAPENSAGVHLKALARISRLFKSATFRQSILRARTPEEIYELISTEDSRP
jgi:PTS system nitrogen regulatory IIA component